MATSTSSTQQSYSFLGTGGSTQGSGDGQEEKLNYVKEAERCKEFLKDYRFEKNPGTFCYKYHELLQEIANGKESVLDIDLNDMVGFFSDDAFLQRILGNAHRYSKMFAKEADALMPLPTDLRLLTAMNGHFDGYAAQEVFRFQRLQAREAAREAAQAREESGEGEDTDVDPQQGFPPELLRTYEVVLTPPAKMQAESLRNVSAKQIGSLVKIKGIVTKVSDVKPRAIVVTYICDRCGNETYQRIGESGEFNPPEYCDTPDCRKIKKRDRPKVHANVRGSKFEKFQEIKIQETPDQVPVGHIPRTLHVQCRGACTRQCNPGDCVELIGIFLPMTVGGFDQIRRGLTASTFLSCMKMKRHKKNYAELSSELTQELEDEIDDLASDRNVYSKLAQSIAPEIFGHLDVKKALLLQLVGGVTKKVSDGLSIRGDLNILLMGDPGVAKSQLLKHIASVAPRGVYTTGKGSSGVGLTACVTRDKSTGEVALEGGALVLADMGICAIDEFDKMEDADRTAIHEVMEQQTVSIAKAGVTTSLNARTSILAAANPLYGRYNKRLSPAKNINLPTALLSRFDLLFLLLDIAERESDAALARHITHVHRHSRHPPLDFVPVRPNVLRAYIAQARRVEPFVPPSLCNQIVEHYVNMRQQDYADAQDAGTHSMLTARQLLSILRMSQALARLHFRQNVSSEDIHEAIRLVRASKLSLEDTGPRESNTDAMQDDNVTRVFQIIRELALAQRTDTVKYSDVEPVVLARGLTVDHLERTLTEYEEINIFQLNPARTKITIVQ